MAPIVTSLHLTASLAIRSPVAIAPSSTLSIPTQILQVLKRQIPSIIPTTYGSINSGPAPGTVVGIVLGSVGGFLLVLWLIYTCSTLGGVNRGSDYAESVVVRDRRKSHGSRSTRSRRMSETVEVRRAPTPVRIVREPERVERIIVEERRETRRERSRGGSDEVVVIEEHSPPRRSKSKREKEKESGYRTVDPLAYGGVVGGRKERRGSGR